MKQTNNNMKKYNSAPLPFMGQKRRFLKAFKEQLQQFQGMEDLVFVDLFGGSGLLSRAIKDELPGATVVYNDYDRYCDRLKAIPATNALLVDLRTIVADVPKDSRIPKPVKDQLLARIRTEAGYIDLVTVSSSLLFSGKFATSIEQLEKETFYNCVRTSDYCADGYLDGITVEHLDYKELYNKYRDRKHVIYTVDPPYLSTEAGHYKNYWKLGDYLDVLTVLAHDRYFYFTSNKSHIIELCTWMGDHCQYENPFKDSAVHTTGNSINWASTYTDIMVCKV